ncbi:MAG: hypothetical protein WB471_06125 [Nocardioides sp.]
MRRTEAGWSRAGILQRVSLERGQVVTPPVVAVAGDRAEVAWTVPARGVRHREVRVASLGDGGPQVRSLTTTRAFRGDVSLGLDVDGRDDGDVLVTYVERRTDERDLVAWLGPHGALDRTTVLSDITEHPVMSGLVPGLAAVVASTAATRLISRVWER